MSHDCLAELQRRICSHVLSPPYPQVPEVARYIPPRPSRRRAVSRAGGDRYWIQLPQWLFRHWQSSGRPAGSRFLGDVLWGQYCLFLFVRIHDDLVDGQARDPRLILIADDLLLESERAFAVHFSGPAFSSSFRELLRTSLSAIVEVDSLQARPGGLNAQQLDLYARVSSIFKVGAAAVALKSGRRNLIQPIAAFCDHLAIAMQILDDLFDIDQDLARGRFNFAANIVLDIRHGSNPAHLTRSVLIENSVGRVVDIARSHLDRAADAIAPARIAAADRYINRLQIAIARYGDAVHRARVERLFERMGIHDVSEPERR